MQTIISIDLETRGQNPATCAIASIGLAIAKTDGGIVHDATWWIDLNDALKYGEEEPETMVWWAKQSQEAQRQLHEGTFLISNVLLEINDRIKAFTEHNNFIIVARAPNFDCTILSRHYVAADIEQPWKYWQERDHRTFEEAYRSVCVAAGINYPSYKQAYPVQHNALGDARNQALYLLHIQQMAAMATRK